MFMYKNYTLVWTGNSVVYSVYCHSRGVCGQAVNTSTSRSAGLQVQGSSLARRVVSLTRDFTPLFFSSPRCINGYRQHTAGGGEGVTLRWTSIPSRGE